MVYAKEGQKWYVRCTHREFEAQQTIFAGILRLSIVSEGSLQLLLGN
jgi:hypothetical protein